MERRFDIYKAQQVELANKKNQEFQTLATRVAVENDEARRQYRVNDLRDENNKSKFEDFDQEFDDIFTRLDGTDSKNEDKFNKVNSLLEEKVFILSKQAEASDKHLNLQIEKLNRELDRQKFDLTDLIDQRQEQMQRTFEAEVKEIKQQYRESIKNVDLATKTLETLF